MRKIETENKATLFTTDGQAPSNESIYPRQVLGLTRQQIVYMCRNPENYGEQILKLMDYMYQESGYMRRLVDYFSHMPKLNYYIDTEVTDVSFFDADDAALKKNYIAFAAQAGKIHPGSHIHDIVKRLLLHDACFAYVSDAGSEMSYSFLPPHVCQITRPVNGNIYEFAVNASLLTYSEYEALPAELQALLEQAKEASSHDPVEIPRENGFCLKYHNHFPHLFPPLLPMVSSILLVEEYKDLAEAKAVNDSCKLLVLKVPTRDGEITMGDELLKPFVATALQVIQDNISVLPYPGDVEPVEFSAGSPDDRDKTEDAVSQMYREQGIGGSLMSGASGDAGLHLSVMNDSGHIFRIYRMLEDWVSFQMGLRNFIYPSYRFVYKIMDMTIFNQTETVCEELRLARAGLPHKARLCAASGLSPGALSGNTRMENVILKDLFDTWQPLGGSVKAGEGDG